MKIAIIGCGWLGMPLAEMLADKGHEVTGTKRTLADNTKTRPHLKLIQFDPRKKISDELASVLETAEQVVLSFTPDRTSVDAYANDCLTTAKLAGDNTRFLMISSTGVYSDDLIIAREEDADYSSAENRLIPAEKKLRDLLRERLTIIRMAGLFGGDRVIVNHMVKSGKVYNGNEPVNLIHREDAIGMCEFVIENRMTGETINACAANHPSRREFYTWLAKQLGTDAPLFENGPAGKTVSSEKSRKLGYVYRKDDLFGFLSQ